MEEALFKELDQIFHPRSMAAVGVSERFENMGMGFLLGYEKHGFKGRLYAINPTKQFKKFETHPSLEAVPGPVDFVKVCVPAAKVNDVIAQCGRKGVKAATIFSSGFREAGTAAGAALEDEVIRTARAGGVRLIGPNCMGIHCPASGMTIRGDMPVTTPGSIGLVSQSGGMAISAVLMAAEKGIGFSKAVSYGNESDLGPPEFLRYLARDPDTRVICLYLEGTRRPDALRAALTDAAARKPVVALKGGVSDFGRRAVESHTGALAGTGETWRALIKQAGAIETHDIVELIETALLLSLSRPPRGRRACLLTISGGFGVFGADQFHAAGFSLPEVSTQTRATLAENFGGPGASTRNPLDLAAQFFQPQYYQKLFTALNDDPNHDFLVLAIAMEYLTFVNSKARDWAGAITAAIQTGLGHMKKPVYLAFFRTALEPMRLELERSFLAAGYPVFTDIKSLLAAVDRTMGGREG